jgi:hypothetical protein
VIDPRAVALLGIGYSPLMLAIMGLLPEEEEPDQPATQGGFSDAPWRWVPFTPVRPRRPRKRRDTDVLFLGR